MDAFKNDFKLDYEIIGKIFRIRIGIPILEDELRNLCNLVLL